MAVSLFALQWTELSFALVVAFVLAACILVPYLIKEIRDGKGELGPLRRLGRGRVTLGPPTPTGAGDNNPGRRGDPAPGQPDGQADPYDARAQRRGCRNRLSLSLKSKLLTARLQIETLRSPIGPCLLERVPLDAHHGHRSAESSEGEDSLARSGMMA